MAEPRRVTGTLLPPAPEKPVAPRMRGPLAYALLLGLVGAGIVHIVVLMLVPGFAESNASARFAAIAGLNRATPIDPAGAVPVLGAPDPAFRMAACRFDLSQGPVHVSAPDGKVPFWSASVYDRGSRNLYSLNDRSGPDGTLDFVVLTQQQMIRVRQDLPEAFTRSVFVEVPAQDGILVVRAFAPDASWRPGVADFFARMTCAPL